MSENFAVEIISPNKLVLKEETEEVKTNEDLREEVLDLSNKTNGCIYFHEKRNNIDFTGWSVKLSTHFIEL